MKFVAQPANLRKINARCKLKTIWQSSMKNANSHLDPAQKPVVNIGIVCQNLSQSKVSGGGEIAHRGV